MAEGFAQARRRSHRRRVPSEEGRPPHQWQLRRAVEWQEGLQQQRGLIMRTQNARIAIALSTAVVVAFGAACGSAGAQSAATAAPTDLTGLWDGAPGGNTRDLNKYMKSQKLAIPFTT